MKNYLRKLFLCTLVFNVFFYTQGATVTKQDLKNAFPDNYRSSSVENLDPEFDPSYVYWPREYNDTSNMLHDTIYIHSWEQDPPNSVILYIYDGRPILVNRTWIDIQIQSGVRDDLNNITINQTVNFDHVEITPQGWTRVPLNVQNNKGMLTRARLMHTYNDNAILGVE